MPPSQVALVTGSGKRRLGHFIAEALAGRGYGLAIHHHRSATEAHEAVPSFQTRGVEALALPADLADEQAARRLVQAVLDHFGRIDVLVNCAAIWQAKRLEEITALDVRRNFEVNVLGTFVCAQQAGRAMVGQPSGGCIVNIGDWAEARPYVNYAAYFATKGAIAALTRCLAVELGTRNPRVRVNCVLPGPVLLQPDLPEAEKRQAIEATLVRHEGRPEHIVQAVLFLIDNDFVTGTCLRVDGAGRSMPAAPDHRAGGAGEAYSVRSASPASAKARRRSAHLLHAPQWRPATGRMHDSVRCNGKPRPRRITSALLSRA
jgi:pteridine reductase